MGPRGLRSAAYGNGSNARKATPLAMKGRFFLNGFLALVTAAILLCLPTGVSSSDGIVTKVAFSRRIGKVNTYVELRCTATEEKPRCDVPDTVKIIQTGSPSRVSTNVVSIPDSLLVTAAKNNAGALAPFERPSFRVTMEDKQVFDVRLTSSITLLIYNHEDSNQDANSVPALPEIYVRHAPKRSTYRPSVFVDATQTLLDLYQTTLPQDAARGSDDVFNSGAFATYVFAPAFNSLKHTLHHLPKIYKKYGYQNKQGKIVKEITEDDVSLVERLTPTLCNGFVELQYWTSAIEEIFIKHSYDTKKEISSYSIYLKMPVLPPYPDTGSYLPIEIRADKRRETFIVEATILFWPCERVATCWPLGKRPLQKPRQRHTCLVQTLLL